MSRGQSGAVWPWRRTLPHAPPVEHGPPGGIHHGVFAIAITLLVLEISVPGRDFEDLWKGIADQWPS